MKKPDPDRFTGNSRAKSKPDKLEMKGFSNPLPPAPITTETKASAAKVSVRTDVRTVERKSVRTNVRKKKKRICIRHAFDIYEDQLRALHTLQLKAVQAGRRKPKLGKMVQKALDQFLENKQKKKT